MSLCCLSIIEPHLFFRIPPDTKWNWSSYRIFLSQAFLILLSSISTISIQILFDKTKDKSDIQWSLLFWRAIFQLFVSVALILTMKRGAAFKHFSRFHLVSVSYKFDTILPSKKRNPVHSIALYWTDFQSLDSYSNIVTFKKNLTKSCRSGLYASFDTF